MTASREDGSGSPDRQGGVQSAPRRASGWGDGGQSRMPRRRAKWTNAKNASVRVAQGLPGFHSQVNRGRKVHLERE